MHVYACELRIPRRFNVIARAASFFLIDMQGGLKKYWFKNIHLLQQIYIKCNIRVKSRSYVVTRREK